MRKKSKDGSNPVQNAFKLMCRSDLLQKSFHDMKIKESRQLIPTGLSFQNSADALLSLPLCVNEGAGFPSAVSFSLFFALALQSEQSRCLLYIPMSRDHPFSWGPFDLRRAKSRAQRKRSTWSVSMIINHCAGQKAFGRETFSSPNSACLSQDVGYTDTHSQRMVLWMTYHIA